MFKNVLIIAASDPSGGAGIEADLKVIAAHGLNGRTALTALTEQDSHGVREVHPTDPEVFKRVLDLHAADLPLAAVKIGALGSAAHVRAAASFLGGPAREVPSVLDPVLRSTSGAALLEAEGEAILRDLLLPLVTLFTPNLAEATALTGREIRDADGMEAAGRDLVQRGARAVLVKGGHLAEGSCDVLVTADAARRFGNRLVSREFHGTGCALASALAAALARGLPLEQAVETARRYLTLCMNTAAPGRAKAWMLGFPPAPGACP